MKNFKNIIIWTVLVATALVQASRPVAADEVTPSSPVAPIGAQVNGGVERILGLFQAGTSASADLDPRIVLETENLRQVVRDCRSRIGADACVQSIDEQIRAFDQRFAAQDLASSPQHDLALTVLHEIRLTAYGVERHGVERHGVER